MKLSDYYRIPTAATIIGVQSRTLHYAFDRGEIGRQLGDGTVVVTLKEVRAWKKRPRKPGPKPSAD